MTRDVFPTFQTNSDLVPFERNMIPLKTNVPIRSAPYRVSRGDKAEIVVANREPANPRADKTIFVVICLLPVIVIEKELQGRTWMCRNDRKLSFTGVPGRVPADFLS